jgi:hypothetical protein
VRTTEVGYTNRSGQTVIRATSLPGNLLGQRVYVLRCGDEDCRHEYGANGCDIHLRKCPMSQRGAPGLPFESAR